MTLPASWSLVTPVGGSWLAILPRDALPGVRDLHALLELGALDAWQNTDGDVLLVPNPQAAKACLELLDDGASPVLRESTLSRAPLRALSLPRQVGTPVVGRTESETLA